MPSTYSNLKIQLMATGENNTTWGDVTNQNLGGALEEAIVGSADVTFASANVTLTLTDTNATQTARNMRLRCTGTTGGSTRNLVVPSIEKPYIVKNECADNIVVKTAAGTGITVPAGATMWVYSDGTNVVDVVSHITSLTSYDVVATNVTATNVAGVNLTATNATITNLTATNVSSSGFNATNSVNDAGTIAATSPGFRGVPASSQSTGSAITLALADAGKRVPNTSGGWVIPANASVAFPTDTAIVLYNNSGTAQNVSITSDTLRWAGTTSTGTRAIGAYGMATIVKVASTTWVITGAGVS